MLIKQNYNACCKTLQLSGLVFAKLKRIILMSRLAFGLALVFSSAEVMMAAPRDNQAANDDASKSLQADISNSKSSSVGERAESPFAG